MSSWSLCSGRPPREAQGPSHARPLVPSLLYCSLIADNLHDRSVPHRCPQLFIVADKHLTGKFAKSLQLVPPDVGPVIFGEAINEKCPFGPSEEYNASVSTDLPCPFRARRCLITPPPRAASTRPFSACRTALQDLSSSIPSRSAKRSNGLVLKTRIRLHYWLSAETEGSNSPPMPRQSLRPHPHQRDQGM